MPSMTNAPRSRTWKARYMAGHVNDGGRVAGIIVGDRRVSSAQRGRAAFFRFSDDHLIESVLELWWKGAGGASEKVLTFLIRFPVTIAEDRKALAVITSRADQLRALACSAIPLIDSVGEHFFSEVE